MSEKVFETAIPFRANIHPTDEKPAVPTPDDEFEEDEDDDDEDTDSDSDSDDDDDEDEEEVTEDNTHDDK